MKQRLTKSVVDRLEVREKGYFARDSELSGFAVRVLPSGVKTYVAEYRRRDGRQRLCKLGRHGELTCNEARLEAKKVIGGARVGRDALEEREEARRKRRETQTLRAVWTEYDRAQVAKLKPRTAAEIRRIFDRYLPDSLRDAAIKEVGPADIGRLHSSMSQKPIMANRVRAHLSAFFAWCEQSGLRPAFSNPCRSVRPYTERRRERFLSEGELRRLGTAIGELEAEGTIGSTTSRFEDMVSAWCISREPSRRAWEKRRRASGALLGS